MPGLYLAALTLLAVLGVSWIARSMARATRQLEIGTGWRDRWSRIRASLARVDTARLLMAVAGVGLAGLVVAVVLQSRLLSAIWRLPDGDAARPAELTVLRTDATWAHHSYVATFAALITAILLLTSDALSRGRSAEDGRSGRRWALAAVGAVVVAAASFLVLPWQLLWDNSREVASCRRPDGSERKAFVVASSTSGDECRYWLYYPDTHERASVACERTDRSAECQRTGRYEYLFGGSSER
jgi:hypothetical protein